MKFDITKYKKEIIIILILIALLAFFYPKNAGGGTCGFCREGEYKFIEHNCAGFAHSGYPVGCLDCSDYFVCYGLVYGPETCYNSSKPPRIEISCEGA